MHGFESGDHAGALGVPFFGSCGVKVDTVLESGLVEVVTSGTDRLGSEGNTGLEAS